METKFNYMQAILLLLNLCERSLGFDLENLKIEECTRTTGIGTMNFFMITVPKKDCFQKIYLENKLQKSLQGHLENHALPASHIPPYSLEGEMIAPLYIDWVVNKHDRYYISATIIDNDFAFKFVKHLKERNRSL